MGAQRHLGPILLVAALLVASGCAGMPANLSEALGGALSAGSVPGGALDEPTVVAGLKEALRIGAGNSVASTARVDGFLGNQLIRIALPSQLRSTAPTLRAVGLGPQVDELEIGMNRAAELAAGEAREIFWNAIAGMSISDAFGILRGHETAATEYFRGRTGGTLRERFHPIVSRKIGDIGLSRAYGNVAGAYNSFAPPGTQRLADLDEYVTEKALDGLFLTLGQEERKIRSDPQARTTELLRRVFGAYQPGLPARERV